MNDAIAILDTLLGINRRIAEILLAEVGDDLSRFPSAEQLASWSYQRTIETLETIACCLTGASAIDRVMTAADCAERTLAGAS